MRMSEAVMDRLENVTLLDRVVHPVQEVVRAVLRPRLVANALHGVWVGHPLHPALVVLPLGALASASILDLLPGTERPVRVLITTGVTAAGPTAVTGLADWAQMHDEQQRIGIVHAGANTVGIGCYLASLVARAAGHQRVGKSLGFAGLGALSVGGYLGGHLAYRQAGGANHAEDVAHLVPPGWHALCAVDDLPPDGTPQRRLLHAVPLVVVRRGERLHVLADRCSHLSGPLHEGRLSIDGTCLTCPWHGSTFRLEDGSVVRGPATAPQPSFDVRVEAGLVQVRLPDAHPADEH